MKQHYCYVATLLLAAATAARGQGVGIGTTTPNPAAALDLAATGKGLLIPRMDSMARAAIANPPTGLLVFQTGPRVGFYYYGGGGWLFLPDKARSGDNLGSHTATQPLTLNGNSLRLRGSTDDYHVLRYDGGVDGPSLYGFAGGSLGTLGTGTLLRAVTWNTDGLVAVRRRLAVDPDGTGDGTTPLLVLGNSNSGEGLASGRTSGSLNVNGLDFYTGFGRRLSITNGGNVGVGTATPASSLTVAGSLATAYNSRTASYTLTAADYFVAYNGTATATFTLPAAQAGTASLQGRTYKLKNNSGQPLVIQAAGSERINSGGATAVVVLEANNGAELISTGATTGTTWELVSSGPPSYVPDALRTALASTGCASCVAYDAARVNTWVSVSAADYAALQSLSGTTVSGPASLANNASGCVGSSTTNSQNNDYQSYVQSSRYPFALAVRTCATAPPTMAGIKLKLSTTGARSGFVDWPTTGTATPNGPTPLAGNTVYYYVLKRPTARTTDLAFQALYTPESAQLGTYAAPGKDTYYEIGDDSGTSGLQSNQTLSFQILATPTKQW